MVTIELQEYEDLKSVDVTAYQKALNLLFDHLAKVDARNIQILSNEFKAAKLQITKEIDSSITIKNVKD